MAHALANTAMVAKLAKAPLSSRQQCAPAKVSARVPRTQAQRRAFKAYAVDAQGFEPVPAPQNNAQINMYNAATIKVRENFNSHALRQV